MRDYTQEEMEVLARLERNFEKACIGNWLLMPDRELISQAYDIHSKAKGWNTRLNTRCGSCLMELLQSIGSRYFEQKNRPSHKVEETPVKAEAKNRQKVTGKKKATKK